LQSGRLDMHERFQFIGPAKSDTRQFQAYWPLLEAELPDGLEPRWCMGSYATFLNLLCGVAVRKYRLKLPRLKALSEAIQKATIPELHITMSDYCGASAAE